MALVLSPWFGRGCGRRTRRPFSFGSPSLFTDLVIIKVPQMQMRQASCAPGQGRNPAMSNARVVQWSETADSHIFKLRLPGLKKEDLHIQVEDDRTLYISYSNQPKEAQEAKDVKDVKEGNKEESAATDAQSKVQKPSNCTFMRKFKLPENADLEEIKAEVSDETLTFCKKKDLVELQAMEVETSSKFNSLKSWTNTFKTRSGMRNSKELYAECNLTNAQRVVIVQFHRNKTIQTY